MVKREKQKTKFDQNNEVETDKSVILLSSSDDEEANEDLSLEIVERARKREAKRKRELDFDEFKASDGVRSVSVIDLTSSSSEEFEVVADLSGGGSGVVAAHPSEVKKDKKKKKKKKIKKIEEEEKTADVVDTDEQVETVASFETEAVGVVETEELVDTIKAVETAKPLEAEVADVSDNIVLRKLLRGPRYFSPPDSSWATPTCYNCGEEGHMAVNCTSKKRKKPCFVCGSFEHSVKHCTKGQDCFICKKIGHWAKNCPEKQQGSSHKTNICLRCGDSGHNMFSCTSDYAPEDLKEIQCYVCKGFGHLCCVVGFIATGPAEVSCYNCGQPGHDGLVCSKLRPETSGTGLSAKLCYRCGEKGHFARRCTAYTKHDPSSTPTQRFSKKVGDLGFRSAPRDLGKKKNKHYEGREFVTEVKPKRRGGWITDDPGDLPNGKAKANGWSSPATPTNKYHKISTSTAGGNYSNSPSTWKKSNLFPRTPSSHGLANHYQHGYSASRFGNYSGGGFQRTYNGQR